VEEGTVTPINQRPRWTPSGRLDGKAYDYNLESIEVAVGAPPGRVDDAVDILKFSFSDAFEA
jgi:hypothetical protein